MTTNLKNEEGFMKRLYVVIILALIFVQQLFCTRMALSGDALMMKADAPERGIGLVERKPQANRIQIGPYWALLIGIDHYDHWPILKTAVKDSETLRKLLGDRYGFEPQRIKQITNRAATREGIIDAFEWLVERAGENDNVLIFFAGHGVLDDVSGYWVPVDARKDKKGAYISNSTIRDYIGAIKAKHVYLIADSCFSGSLFGGATRSKPPTITSRYFQEAYNRLSRQGLTSGGTEPVSDDGYDGHSIFAYYFLKALRENTHPYLTATTLFDRIAVPVANNSRQTPINRPLRDVKDEGGEFIFALNGVGMSESDVIKEGGNDMDPPTTQQQIASLPKRTIPLRTIILMTEKNLGIPRNVSIVGNALSEKLGDRGIRVISDSTIGMKRIKDLKQVLGEGSGITSVRDDLKQIVESIVWGSSDTRLGNTGVDGLVSCLANASVEVISVKTGEIIAQSNLENVRGFGGNEESACLNALRNAGDQMSKAIVEKLGNQ